MAHTTRRKRTFGAHPAKPFASMSKAEKIREARKAIERLQCASITSPRWNAKAIAKWEATLRGLGVEP